MFFIIIIHHITYQRVLATPKTKLDSETCGTIVFCATLAGKRERGFYTVRIAHSGPPVTDVSDPPACFSARSRGGNQRNPLQRDESRRVHALSLFWRFLRCTPPFTVSSDTRHTSTTTLFTFVSVSYGTFSPSLSFKWTCSILMFADFCIMFSK